MYVETKTRPYEFVFAKTGVQNKEKAELFAFEQSKCLNTVFTQRERQKGSLYNSTVSVESGNGDSRAAVLGNWSVWEPYMEYSLNSRKLMTWQCRGLILPLTVYRWKALFIFAKK